MKEIKKHKVGTFGWIKEQAKKDGFGDNIRKWHNWKRYHKMVKNIEQIRIYDKKEFTDNDREIFYRFWSKVDIKSIKECWNWLGYIDDGGYGEFSLDNYPIRTHRFSYLLTKGKITEPQVQHLCNNRLCCNPNHLILGDQSKNIKYMYECDRHEKMHGENHGMSILTDDQVREIHSLKDGFKQRQIAEMFNINQGTVSDIINGKRWRYIYEELNLSVQQNFQIRDNKLK